MKYAHHTSLEMSVISHIHVRHPPFWISFGQLYFVCVVGEGSRVVSNKDHEFYFEIHENIVFGYLVVLTRDQGFVSTARNIL